ncbi:uncharacterized protein K489DRAFT_232990 [Dissoconium aciculare CBS 342.82]|uniref:Uncharacterized protein n=1 Tax=Dissoconium aciculare CBS 342.82 TaxID=1314786 RepID=A0A6J3M268_9PEZI|nr:uncharacterized protein K489DRAFT_232990 [Dissoconium aciculare CBS 342.82]KAF1822101.1 hypothetical protein K489DRAFT_232990 [Dissoconium aciculare CBS 342.82]
MPRLRAATKRYVGAFNGTLFLLGFLRRNIMYIGFLLFLIIGFHRFGVLFIKLAVLAFALAFCVHDGLGCLPTRKSFGPAFTVLGYGTGLSDYFPLWQQVRRWELSSSCRQNITNH